MFFFRPVNTFKPNFISFLVFVGAAASFTAKIHVLKLSGNEKPFESRHKTVNIHGYSELTGANQNARKLLSTDLVNTKS